jgi:putative phage-type endonuclease
MKTIEGLKQGDAAWHTHRAGHWNASDAPAMLGCSPYLTRRQLLQQLHTGLAPEVDAATQRRFDAGHRFEALARPLAEEIIGDDLAPVVGSEGELSASFDGLTLMGDTAFEHKTLGADLRAVLDPHREVNDLPKHYRVQMEQQCMVAGCTRVLFMASSWSGDTLTEERHCWYYPDPALRAEIIAGWTLFASDLAAYVPTAAADPAPAGRAPETLPALHIEVTGMVTASNLEAFKANALAVFAGINRSLTTDEEFADAEKTVKWCGEVEDRLKAAKKHALSQTESIDALFRTIDAIGAEARTVRLELDKLVKARKEQVKGEIVQAGAAALREFIAGLNVTIGKPYMPAIPADFAGVIRGMKKIDSLRDAVDQELAWSKIAANEIAGTIVVNMRHLRENAADYKALFPDVAQIVLKQPDDLQALVSSRIAAQRAEDERKEAAQRERIRQEEVARLERERQEAEALERRQREADEAQARKTAEAAKPAQSPAPAATAAPAVSSNAGTVVPMGPAAESTATIRLGEINARLAPISLTADGLAELGFQPVATVKAAKLYRETSFEPICSAVIKHVIRCRHQGAARRQERP